jgi:hypothetical protein
MATEEQYVLLVPRDETMDVFAQDENPTLLALDLPPLPSVPNAVAKVDLVCRIMHALRMCHCGHVLCRS